MKICKIFERNLEETWTKLLRNLKNSLETSKKVLRKLQRSWGKLFKKYKNFSKKFPKDLEEIFSKKIKKIFSSKFFVCFKTIPTEGAFMVLVQEEFKWEILFYQILLTLGLQNLVNVSHRDSP